ncbi:thioesterase II family protein [Streptomyces caatingaensis]|uniref:Oleoyl-ACP hydrolase n=1 Tax=Streptomyces caatingaensis TaxID=1678637 RepID=A0A0K9XDY9_9ACTN|nr:alpha/beta fold hydrolase [Streptomyces caatingaensis]KNB50867.1 oleoyl-ACP hydrolase [Streptomyces caatingaensis]
MTEDDELWLRCFRPAPESSHRLLCFPHAGGAASSFLPLARSLAPDVEVLAVQYPGRQDRRNEPHFTSIGELADRIHRVAAPRLDESTALLGHSMGAVLAFEVVRRMERETGRTCAGLFASGRRAPSCRREEDVHRRDDSGLLAELMDLGGTDPRILQDDELLAAFLPCLRADYEAIETYRADDGVTVGCPVTVMVGEDDPRTTLEEADAWRQHTTAAFELWSFPGGHFFLDGPHHAQVVRTIAGRLGNR